MKRMRSQARVDVIQARNAPVAVIFRRGPSKRVLLIKWDIQNDTFEYGQWLSGRIYERRCDLSPEGDLLLYFAANYREPYYSWTGVSCPPYLTALALWPKGDCYGGGGLFSSRRVIELNHQECEMALEKDFAVPRLLTVRQFGDHPGWGEDEPVWSKRLMRDGWTLVSHPTGTKNDFGAKVGWEFSPPIVWRKPNPVWPKLYSLEMSIVGLHEQNGSWYMTEHSVISEQGKVERIGRSDWADWSHTGDLLFSMNGCLYRLPHRSGVLGPLEEAVEVADFTKLQFEPCRAPQKALRWPSM